jgi:hypothetical protein
MSYIIEDTGASIRFTGSDGFFFLMKTDIKSIRSIRDDMIKIDTGCCFTSIFIYPSSVTAPAASSALHLADILNNWITVFLNGFQDSDSPGEGE